MIRYFMQIVSLDNLHEVSDPIFSDKIRKYDQFVVCCIFPSQGKCKIAVECKPPAQLVYCEYICVLQYDLESHNLRAS